ncbi:MAG: hypothetical protein ACP5IA_11725 [Sediminispirochaetaceae bacterium]
MRILSLKIRRFSLCGRVAAILLILLLQGISTAAAFPLPAGNIEASLPENSYVRSLYLDRILGPIESAAELSADVLNEPGYEHQVQFFVQEEKDIIYFCFYHGKDINFARPVTGSIVLQRSRATGRLMKMKIFYKDEADSYISIEPEGEDSSVMDILLLGDPMQQDITLPFSLEDAAAKPVAELMRSSAAYVDWSFYLPREEFPFPVLSSTDDLVQQIRPYLGQLKDVDDGAINAEGRFVFIEDGSPQPDEGPAGLNCSGFAKWIVDGVLYPVTGRLLPIDRLKEPHLDYRGNRWSEKVEDAEDPYFGLDWTRNLAVEALKVHSAADGSNGGPTGGSEPFNPEAADVDYLRYHEYEEDVGYSVERLKTALYELARANPNSFYLGSVNELVHGGYELRKHLHVAVFFAWLDEKGGLQVSVMERTEETSIDEFIDRYRGEFVHLAEVPHTGVFKPGTMRLDPVIKR